MNNIGIYQISCGNCCGIYISKTGRHFNNTGFHIK